MMQAAGGGPPILRDKVLSTRGYGSYYANSAFYAGLSTRFKVLVREGVLVICGIG